MLDLLLGDDVRAVLAGDPLEGGLGVTRCRRIFSPQLGQGGGHDGVLGAVGIAHGPLVSQTEQRGRNHREDGTCVFHAAPRRTVDRWEPRAQEAEGARGRGLRHTHEPPRWHTPSERRSTASWEPEVSFDV